MPNHRRQSPACSSFRRRPKRRTASHASFCTMFKAPIAGKAAERSGLFTDANWWSFCSHPGVELLSARAGSPTETGSRRFGKLSAHRPAWVGTPDRSFLDRGRYSLVVPCDAKFDPSVSSPGFTLAQPRQSWLRSYADLFLVFLFASVVCSGFCVHSTRCNCYGSAMS